MSQQHSTPKRKPWKEPFLEAIKGGATVSGAANIAGIDRSTPYREKEADPLFEKAWADATEEGLDVIEAEAFRRGVEGISKPIFYKGKQVARVTEYSDTLLIFLLKGRRREIFGDRTDVTSKGKEIKTFTLDLSGAGPQAEED